MDAVSRRRARIPRSQSYPPPSGRELDEVHPSVNRMLQTVTTWSEPLKCFMMHILRNSKTGRKSAGRGSTRSRRISQTAVYPGLEGAVRDSNANLQTFVGFKIRV